MPFSGLPVLSVPGFSAGGGGCDYPAESDVRDGVVYDFGLMTGTLNVIVPLDPPNPPVILTSQSSPFAAIVQAIRARVSTAIAIAPEYVRLVANDNYKVTETEDLFVYIRVYGPNPFTDGGAGRLARNISRRIRFYVYTRSGVDTYGGDEIALLGLNPSQTVATPPVYPGQFVAEESVYNYLDDWTPLDSGGNALTIGPLHIIDSSSGPPERDAENEAGLVRSALDVEVCYVLCQDPTEPPP